ncbi:type VI secretion system baseplate subunit TssE [Paraburkholderia bannensis]|uniref:type VI secretion system baseplate subunit TssE n=1 Tax=Paraburkholderia bannensis TaxID=765414 RepID=UPI002AB194D4|nr:type VI secretion system baseplate subunit TssE [Paraburkholderia bannensis]
MPPLRPPAFVAPMPLFERLADDAPFDAHERTDAMAARRLDAQGLRDSVRAELLRLLNTRRGRSMRETADVLHYGLPDWSALSAARAGDRSTLERDVAQAIRAFEPRLAAPRVTIEPDADAPWRLCLRIAGLLCGLDGAQQPARFLVRFDADSHTPGIVDE